MTKSILLTGATDGIGFETAKDLVSKGHTVLIHGRNPNKLAATRAALLRIDSAAQIEVYQADLSRLVDVAHLADEILTAHKHLDVIINNAGIFKTPHTQTADGLDMRFMVNAIAPYVLTQRLLPILPRDGRVLNLSSAAQARVDLTALAGDVQLSDSSAYAQSKLAITMWSFHMAQQLGSKGPLIVAINPASLLGSKMVKEAYGIAGGDLTVGSDVLVEAALSPRFADANGRYYDNDNRQFADPHPDALSAHKNAALVQALEQALQRLPGA